MPIELLKESMRVAETCRQWEEGGDWSRRKTDVLRCFCCMGIVLTLTTLDLPLFCTYLHSVGPVQQVIFN